MKWIAVTGGRAYRDYAFLSSVLADEKPDVVVQGECPVGDGGADGLTKRWCEANGVRCVGIYAWFSYYGKSAGPRRNGWIFDLFPIEKLVAFDGDRGTSNCVDQAIQHGVPVRDERGKNEA